MNTHHNNSGSLVGSDLYRQRRDRRNYAALPYDPNNPVVRSASRRPAQYQPSAKEKVLFYLILFCLAYSLGSLLLYYLGMYFGVAFIQVNAIPLGLAMTVALEFVFLVVELRETRKSTTIYSKRKMSYGR